MNSPVLYVKKGCPFCQAAMEYLDQKNIRYEPIDVRGDTAKMETLKKISGQTKTPTLLWDGDVLADFGVEQLDPFVAKHQAA